MKNNFDKNIKDKLNNYEAPYDPAAWTKMNATLNNVSPVRLTAKYWFIGAAILTIVAVASSFFFKNEAEVNSEKNINAQIKSESTNNNDIDNSTSKQEISSLSSKEAEQITKSFKSLNNIESAVNKEVNTPLTQEDNSQLTQDPNHQTSQLIVDDKNTPESLSFIDPEITAQCQGENMTVVNKNNFKIFIGFPDGIKTVIYSKASKLINLTQSGKYTYGYLNKVNQLVEVNSFVINEAPVADFSFINTDVKFDEYGLPSTQVESSPGAASYEWTFDDQKASGNSATGHFFKKGMYEVALKVTSANGCAGYASKQIEINENYNLMAVNSFVPTDSDPQVNRFMPFSLTVRNTPFQLLVFDPTDGHIVFETNDASNGWDGIDKQTGKQVSNETAFIWKVMILNPINGETPEYAGTIIPLARRR